MNELNYASLEASKRLVKAGIVLETEAVWHLQGDNETYFLQSQGSSAHLCVRWGDFPAPCMAEVWRELPDEITIKKWDGKLLIIDDDGTNFNINPADALIELLIWLEKEKLRETKAVKKDPVIDKNSAAYMDN